MSSLDALKYRVTTAPSYYAGAIIFLLYSIVISLTLFIIPLSPISLFFYLILFLIALIAANKAYKQSFEFRMSEFCLIEREVDGRLYNGKISDGSFYNGFVIFLKLEIKANILSDKKEKQFMTIYKDALSEEHYRLLARLINNK